MRLIIDYEGMTANEALARVACVVASGKNSEAAGIPHYCWVSRFHDGVEVAARRKKSKDAADSFAVRRVK